MYEKKWIVAFGVIFFGIAAINAAAQTETWQIDPAHSAAQFSVRHMGISTVRGQFQKVTGTANYDPKDVSKTSLDATIETSSIDTRVEMRDNDLKGTNFFDVQKYPTLAFRSTRVTRTGKETYAIEGDLTIHGVSKRITVPARVIGVRVMPGMGDFAGSKRPSTLTGLSSAFVVRVGAPIRWP